MKIVTPDYYKNFKCIAGECTDTCCAGWDVDVDKESYKQYRRVIGSFGNKLRSVMVPSEDGGCTFTLKEGRCPFLNTNFEVTSYEKDNAFMLTDGRYVCCRTDYL